MRKMSWRVLVTLCACLVGILLMFQLKAQGSVKPAVGADNILPQLVEQNQQNAQLKAENDRLGKELQELQDGANAAALADKDLQRATLLAGLDPVEGPGIEITLDDSKQTTNANNVDDADFYVIHQEYLQQIVNALWNVKADAVAINGQRIMENSEILCMGSYISINNTVQTPPYVITAIGDYKNLSEAVNFYVNHSLGYYVDTYGIQVNEQQVKELRLPAGKMPLVQYASPVKG